jgi:hypothetical protein
LSFPSVSKEPFVGSSVLNQNNVTKCSRNSKVVPPCESKKSIERCEICQVQVSCSDSLAKHMELCHTKHEKQEVPIQCTKCPKTYTELTSLREHLVVDHGNSIPLSKDTCDLCGYIGSSSFRLRRHMFYTHQQKDNPKIICLGMYQ